jgi:zinc transport system permease protein
MEETALTLDGFFAAWELFRDPALAGALAGALLGFLGVYVVLRRMVFLSAALTQAAGLGVAGSFYAQLHLGATGLLAAPMAGATAATLLATALLASVRGPGRDRALGIAYLVGAAGTVAVGTRIAQEVQDIHGLLFGSAVVVLPGDLALLGWVAGAIGLVHLLGVRGFVQASFDRDGAAVRGLPVRTLEVSLLVSVAVAISVCTRVLGALPVFAFSVLPAAAAIRLAPNVPRALWGAAALGAAAGFGGYVVAYLARLPVGAAQALVAAGLVALAEGAVRLRARGPRRSGGAAPAEEGPA